MLPSVFVLPASGATFPEINTLWSESHLAFCRPHFFFVPPPPPKLRFVSTINREHAVLGHYRHVSLQRTLEIMSSLRVFLCRIITSKRHTETRAVPCFTGRGLAAVHVGRLVSDITCMSLEQFFCLDPLYKGSIKISRLSRCGWQMCIQRLKL